MDLLPDGAYPAAPIERLLNRKAPPAPGATMGWEIELVSQGLGSIFPTWKPRRVWPTTLSGLHVDTPVPAPVRTAEPEGGSGNPRKLQASDLGFCCGADGI
jgi:hypothetical protein